MFFVINLIMLLIRVSFHGYEYFHEYDDHYVMIMNVIIFVVTEIPHP